MRILFLAHRIPFPPNKGDKIRSFHEVKGLAARGHEVHLLAFADDPNDLNPHYQRELMAAGCASVGIEALDRRMANLRALIGLAGSRPLSLAFYASSAMGRRIDSIVASAQPHAMVVYSSSVAQYVPDAFAARTIVDLVDVDSEKWRDYASHTAPPRSWVYAEEARRLSAYERAIVTRFAGTLVTTEPERADLLGAAAGRLDPARVHVLPNGVDVDYFRPQSPASEPAPGVEPSIVFTGAMDYYANADAVTWLATEVLPLVRARVPAARFVIVGSNPSTEVRRLAALAGVTVTGAVPDVRPYVAGATVSVAPLRIARGVQNKVLEAMAMARAVVATPQAAAGLSATPGRDLIVADGPDAFAGEIIRMLVEPDARTAVGSSARRFVEAAHNWATTLDHFERLVSSAAAGA